MDNGQQNQEMLANNDKFQEKCGFDNKSVTFMDVMNEINEDDYKRTHYRRYIHRMYESWKKEDHYEKVNDGHHRVLGSKIVFPENKELNDLFTDSSLINVIDYLITNNVRIVSDITEEVLIKLLFYPNVDYIKFKATTDILFVAENVSEIIKNEDDQQEFESINANELNEEVEEESHSDGTLVENPEINEYIHLELFKSEDVERIFKETLWFTSTLQEEIEKRQQSIIDLQTLYLNTKAKAAEQQQIIEEMKLKEMELKETIGRQHESIIEMQDLHEDQLRIKDQEIDSRDRALATKDQDLSHKNMLIASIEANLEIKNEELNLANKELSTKDTLIAERDAELEKRIQELGVTNQELSTKNMLFSEREADLERKIRELDQTNQELIAKDMLLAERNEDLVKKNQDLDIAYQEIIAKNKLLADREMELAVVTQELESLREEKTAEKRSFIEFTKVKETMQNVIKLLRGDNDSELSSEKKEKEIS